MHKLISNPPPTFDEAFEYAANKLLPAMPAEVAAIALEFGRLFFTVGTAWTASIVMKQNTCVVDDRRAPCAAALDIQIEAEKILAQSCPATNHKD